MKTVLVIALQYLADSKAVMDTEQEQRLDELFYRDSQWVADNGRYVHENNGALSFLVS